jgi:hypothetical protein
MRGQAFMVTSCIVLVVAEYNLATGHQAYEQPHPKLLVPQTS